MPFSTREVQLVQLSILKQVIHLCTKYNLKYIAVGGTALGAYRHQGFIPWDDDIDIAMPRKDYDQFIQLQHELTGHFIQTLETDLDYNLHFSKVRKDNTIYIESVRAKYKHMHHGVWIDIFPLDAYQEDPVWIKKVFNTLTRYRRASKPIYGRFLLKALLYKLIYGSEKYNRKILYSTLQEKSDTEYSKIGNVFYNDIFDIDQVENPIQGKFEDIMINLPARIEDYLENKYGDYMTIPPESEQINHNPIEIQL